MEIKLKQLQNTRPPKKKFKKTNKPKTPKKQEDRLDDDDAEQFLFLLTLMRYGFGT